MAVASHNQLLLLLPRRYRQARPVVRTDPERCVATHELILSVVLLLLPPVSLPLRRGDYAELAEAAYMFFEQMYVWVDGQAHDELP